MEIYLSIIWLFIYSFSVLMYIGTGLLMFLSIFSFTWHYFKKLCSWHSTEPLNDASFAMPYLYLIRIELIHENCHWIYPLLLFKYRDCSRCFLVIVKWNILIIHIHIINIIYLDPSKLEITSFKSILNTTNDQ